MSQNEKKDHNVVDLAAARKRQRTVQPKASGRAGASGKGAKDDGGQGGLTKKIVGGIQLVLFLAVLFYFTRLCGRG